MINQCNFIGRVGRDPETRFTQPGTAITNFSIACSERWKDKDGSQREKTEWINVVAWNRLAEICRDYLQKGSLVYISGSMQTRKWQDQDGNDRYTTEIIAREMKMLSSKADQPQGQPRQQDDIPPSTGDDVPF